MDALLALLIYIIIVGIIAAILIVILDQLPIDGRVKWWVKLLIWVIVLILLLRRLIPLAAL